MIHFDAELIRTIIKVNLNLIVLGYKKYHKHILPLLITADVIRFYSLPFESKTIVSIP